MNKLVDASTLSKYTVCMGLRGPKPKGKVAIEWSPEFAYAMGLIATDGSLSKNGRIVDFTSKDQALVQVFIDSLKIVSVVGTKKNGSGYLSFRTQIGDVLFHKFLQKIGMFPNKTKTLAEIRVPEKYFADFLRGHFDGDGSSYSYFDKRWKNSFMFYVSFVSASKKHIYWIQKMNKKLYGVSGYMKKVKDKEFYELRYAKKEGLVIANKMYYNPSTPCLLRKRKKLLDTIRKNAQVEKLVNSLP